MWESSRGFAGRRSRRSILVPHRHVLPQAASARTAVSLGLVKASQRVAARAPNVSLSSYSMMKRLQMLSADSTCILR